MSSPHILSSFDRTESVESSDIVLTKSTINSNQELTHWLETLGISAETIGRIAVSFMAKIPVNTPVKIIKRGTETLLHVGESIIRLGETLKTVHNAMRDVQQQVRTLLAPRSQDLLPSGSREALPSGKKASLAAPRA